MPPIDFSKYDVVHCGVSGGKDSQSAATWLVKDSGCQVDKIRLSFCDTDNEHEITYRHIRQIETWLGVPIEWIKAELGFYELAQKKGRFPSAKARFCTEYLKMQVSQKHILQWMQADKKVLLITGVRRDESKARSELPEFDFDTYYACDVYRPLIDWTRQQVFDYLASRGQFANPLYDLGAMRVGCFPCIMSNKHEIRMIADKFPERIDNIEKFEQTVGLGDGSFFQNDKVPLKFRRKLFTRTGKTWKVCGIRDVVDWSHTGKGAKFYNSGPQTRMSFLDDAPTCANNSGACE